MIEDDVLVALSPILNSAPEERGQTPELILAPGFVRMVVALRAIETPAEEDPDLFGHGFAGRADYVIGRKCRVDHRSPALSVAHSHLIVWLVRGDARPDPLAVHGAPLRLDAVRENGHAEDVFEPEGPVVRRTPASRSVCRSVSRVFGILAGEELAYAVGGRQCSRQIETNPPEELGISGQVAGLNSKPTELFEDELIDVIVRRRPV